MELKAHDKYISLDRLVFGIQKEKWNKNQELSLLDKDTLSEGDKMYWGTLLAMMDWFVGYLNREADKTGIPIGDDGKLDTSLASFVEDRDAEANHWYEEYSERSDSLQDVLVEINKIVLSKDETLTKEQILEKLNKIVEPYYTE